MPRLPEKGRLNLQATTIDRGYGFCLQRASHVSGEIGRLQLFTPHRIRLIMGRMAKPEMTQVAGYFNNAKWPIQIVLSKLNITLTLEPGAFIRNASGQKVKDPHFEAFAKHGPLSRELSDVPMPICCVHPEAAKKTATPT